MEETSLDEFLNSTDEDADSEAEREGEADEEKEGEADEERTSEADREEIEADLKTADSAAAEPAISTSRWVRGGQECPSCGTATARLWNDEGTFVCRCCKDW